MADAPTVSVVLVTYNHSRFIEASVSSVLADLPDGYELIVVDDGSTDDTLSKVSSFSHPALRALTKTNGGPSSALNYGIANARCPYIALMSGDDVSLPRGIERRLSYLQKSGADIASAVPLLIDENGDPKNSKLFEGIFKPADDQGNLATTKKLLFQGNFISAPSVILHRSVLDKIGVHSDALYQLQDYDLWLRASLAGYQISISEDAFIAYRLHESNLSSESNNFRIYMELEAILRRTALSMTRQQLDMVSARHKASDPDSVARALLFLSTAHQSWQVVAQEMLELAVLDNTACAALAGHDLTPANILERRKGRPFGPPQPETISARAKRLARELQADPSHTARKIANRVLRTMRASTGG